MSLTPEQTQHLLGLARVLVQSLPRGSEFLLGVAVPGWPGVQTASNIATHRQPEFVRLIVDSFDSGKAEDLGSG